MQSAKFAKCKGAKILKVKHYARCKIMKSRKTGGQLCNVQHWAIFNIMTQAKLCKVQSYIKFKIIKDEKLCEVQNYARYKIRQIAPLC